MNREERVRRALQATILHWPGDLNKVSIQAYEDDPIFGGWPRVWVLLKWRDDANDYYVIRIPFKPSELQLHPEAPLLRLAVESAARTYAKTDQNLDRPGRRETSYTDPDR